MRYACSSSDNSLLIVGVKTFANWWKKIVAEKSFAEKTFVEKTFVDCSLVLPKDPTLPNFSEKAFANSHKTSKFVKVFSLPLYGS